MFVCARCLLENLPIQRSKHTKQLVAVVVAFARKTYHKEGCFLCNGRTVLGFIGLTVRPQTRSVITILCVFCSLSNKQFVVFFESARETAFTMSYSSICQLVVPSFVRIIIDKTKLIFVLVQDNRITTALLISNILCTVR